MMPISPATLSGLFNSPSCSPFAALALARSIHVEAVAVNRNATTSTLQRFAIFTQCERCFGSRSVRSTYAILPARTVSSTSDSTFSRLFKRS